MIYFKAYCVGCIAYFAHGKMRDCETRATLTGKLRCRSRVNMAAPRTKEGQRGLKVYQGQNSIADFEHNMETVFTATKCVRMDNHVQERPAKISAMKNDQNARLHPLQRKTLEESGWLWINWRISWQALLYFAFKLTVTVEQKWAHHYAPETKCQNTERKHPSSAVKDKFKIRPLVVKVILEHY